LAASHAAWAALHAGGEDTLFPRARQELPANAAPSGRVLAASVVLAIRRSGAEYDRMREVEARAAAWAAEELYFSTRVGRRARPLPALMVRRCRLTYATTSKFA